MGEHGVPLDELSGLGTEARRSVLLAEVEAHQLAHDRIGTEHLLLGLLANDRTEAARVLAGAGVEIGAARHKVAEATPAVARADGDWPDVLPHSDRAARALQRAVRFAHAAHAPEVGTGHLLLAVLDVEGTAGQVLRGLGVDIDRLDVALRNPVDADEPGAAIESIGSSEPTEPTEPAAEARARREPDPEAAPVLAVPCPGCGAPLDEGVAYRMVWATGSRGTKESLLYSCPSCGRFLGVAPS